MLARRPSPRSTTDPGREASPALADERGFSRITPIPLQPRSAWSPGTMQAIDSRLQAGEDVLEIAHSLHVCASDVYAIEIQRRLRLPHSADDVAAPTRRRQRSERNVSSTQRLRTLRERCVEPRRLWLQGLSIKEIASQVGIGSASLRDLMEQARQQLGEDSFPYRTLLKHRLGNGAALRSLQARLIQQFTQAHCWWCSGVDRASIASRLGMSPERFISASKRVRRVLGNDWFPPRDLQPIADVHDATGPRPRTAEEYALILGMMCWTPELVASLGAGGTPAVGDAYPATGGSAALAALPSRITQLATQSRFSALFQDMAMRFGGLMPSGAPRSGSVGASAPAGIPTTS